MVDCFYAIMDEVTSQSKLWVQLHPHSGLSSSLIFVWRSERHVSAKDWNGCNWYGIRFYQHKGIYFNPHDSSQVSYYTSLLITVLGKRPHPVVNSSLARHVSCFNPDSKRLLWLIGWLWYILVWWYSTLRIKNIFNNLLVFLLTNSVFFF